MVLAFLTVSFALGALGIWALARLGFDNPGELLQTMLVILVFMAITAIALFVVLDFLGRVPLKPVNDIINNMNRLASGDFKARLHFGKLLSNHRTFKEIEQSFNYEDSAPVEFPLFLFWLFYIFLGFLLPMPFLVLGLIFPHISAMGKPRYWYSVAIAAGAWIALAILLMIAILV